MNNNYMLDNFKLILELKYDYLKHIFNTPNITKLLYNFQYGVNLTKILNQLELKTLDSFKNLCLNFDYFCLYLDKQNMFANHIDTLSEIFYQLTTNLLLVKNDVYSNSFNDFTTMYAIFKSGNIFLSNQIIFAHWLSELNNNNIIYFYLQPYELNPFYDKVTINKYAVCKMMLINLKTLLIHDNFAFFDIKELKLLNDVSVQNLNFSSDIYLTFKNDAYIVSYNFKFAKNELQNLFLESSNLVSTFNAYTKNYQFQNNLILFTYQFINKYLVMTKNHTLKFKLDVNNLYIMKNRIMFFVFASLFINNCLTSLSINKQHQLISNSLSESNKQQFKQQLLQVINLLKTLNFELKWIKL